MFSKSIILLVCLVGAAMGDKSIAMVSGPDSLPMKPFLHTMSQDEFAELLEPYSKTTMMLCFLEPGLSLSHFSCSKPDSKGTCYANMKESPHKAIYNVESPSEAMRQLSPDTEYVAVDANGKLGHEVKWQARRVLFVSLEDVDCSNEAPSLDRMECHDRVMSEISKGLSKQGPITAVYTGTQSTNISKSRRRRATATSGTRFRSGKDFLIFFTDLYLQTPNPSTEPNQPPVIITPIAINAMTISDKNETSFHVNLNGPGNKMTFQINLVGGYFEMKNLVLNDETFFVPSTLVSPTDFSYYCGNQTFVSTNFGSGHVILWNSLQMQAPFNDQVKEDFKFGDPWYCVGFFSSGILAGLFVVFILLGILSVGICWMLDINTMDRFDDPKGKTITINVSE